MSTLDDALAASELDYPRIRAAMASAQWAILPAKLAEIVELVNVRAQGGRYTADEVQARVGAARRPAYATSGSVAVLPLIGTIIPRGNILTDSSGVTSVQGFTRSFREAMRDESVGSILIEVDSPGGVVDGVPELADEIRAARGTKPIVAHANTMAASAAYWIASAADELVVTPSGEVGSIGVFTVHYDQSGLLQQMGIQPTFISAGRYKVEGNPFEPLGQEAREYIQGVVDEVYDSFVGAVAKGRGVGIKEVRANFGEGRMVTAAQARRAGMVDRVETIDATIARLSGAKRSGSGRRADTMEPGANVQQDGHGRSASTERRRRGLWLMSVGRRESSHG